MGKKITYIPTLQAYVKERKKKYSSAANCRICNDCSYYRNEFELCVWGENIRKTANLTACPASIKLF